MSSDNSGLQAKLQVLENLFRERLPSKIQEMEVALERFLINPQDQEALTSLHRALHTMAGSAGTFGFSEIGVDAREFEKKLKPILTGETWTKKERNAYAKELRAYFEDAILCAANKIIPTLLEESVENQKEDASSRLVYMVDDDNETTQSIKVQLEHFGYEVVLITQLKSLAVAIATRRPDIVVMEFGSPDGKMAGADEIARIKLHARLHIPTIFVSHASSFENRLQAVRAGGDGYFTKPVDIVALTERIDAVVGREEPKSYRILVIDDDVVTSEYYGAVLRNAGMSVRTLHDPARMLNTLTDFRPELILLDVYMPLCSGVELSKMIRQDNSYLDIPIVFLSSENDMAKQLEAVKAGADDFITKPIEAQFLVSSLATRAERYRSLRALIMRDGLTGLYNHTAIKEELAAEISIAGRNQTSLALAVLDLDFFKNVNDTYGHPVGDQVLRTLSRLLKQRLRRSDIVGRYGGEEFVIIFPGTTAKVAGKVLDQIRVAFNKIEQHAEQGEFSVSFSAGVADLEQTIDADELFDIADSALYRAKQGGRNRIALASP
ncbi:diguanylate cyclase [Undibacterium sp. Jales W-56]|uniref:diguanylate cyclase n=1 Tax=Undibacterium sp. Jales W-56 TaxID=2897325 RepID=UPI0021CF431C|nr:diguanylate cyclase [Undibacterium sp. Jales W-56]MCU6432947.1 diguanylate cyclase [Undibacterium sp. Jales W-56]